MNSLESGTVSHFLHILLLEKPCLVPAVVEMKAFEQ